MIPCIHCGKLNEHSNFCNMDCHIGYAKSCGGQVIAPNGLPISCIRWDHAMLEHPHADHKDYRFTVVAEDGDEIESHAVIYSDGHVVVTICDCRYYMFRLFSGRQVTPRDGSKLTEESLEKIRKHFGG